MEASEDSLGAHTRAHADASSIPGSNLSLCGTGGPQAWHRLRTVQFVCFERCCVFGRRAMLLVLCVLAVAVFGALPASAEKRVALIIGNSAYQQAGTLANPVNDAKEMAAALQDLGFVVLLGLDLDKRAFDIKVRDFSRALADADTGVFFYAGHGLQIAGRNYLIPIDAQLHRERDVDFEA